jgi:hypothetical protein
LDLSACAALEPLSALENCSPQNLASNNTPKSFHDINLELFLNRIYAAARIIHFYISHKDGLKTHLHNTHTDQVGARQKALHNNAAPNFVSLYGCFQLKTQHNGYLRLCVLRCEHPRSLQRNQCSLSEAGK